MYNNFVFLYIMIYNDSFLIKVIVLICQIRVVHLRTTQTRELFHMESIAEGHVLMETLVTIVYRMPGISVARLLLVHLSCNTVMVSTIFAAAQMMTLSVTKDTYTLENAVFVI